MKQLKPVNVTGATDILRLAQEVAKTGVSVMLKTDEEDLAVLTPVSKKKRYSGRAKPVTRDDPLFKLIGIGRSKTEGGVSDRKHEALARAYRPK